MGQVHASVTGVSAFPATVPDSLDDASTIQEHDWLAFRGVEAMENHWERPGWSLGRRSYHWMLSFHEAPGVRKLAAECQARLRDPSFDHVPLDALHVTLGRVAFTDEIDGATAYAAAENATEPCARLCPFDLTIGPLAGSGGALRFSVAPWIPLLALHQVLAAATRRVLGGRAVMDTAAFRPHLSIAYANATVPVSSLLPVLADLRQLETTSAVVHAVELVELRRDGRTYRFEELVRVKLQAAGA